MSFDPATGAGIAIVLPAKNEARGLAEVLPRLTELYPQAQISVVDDGSTDDTAQIAQSLSNHAAEGNIKLIRRKHYLTPNQARNIGVAYAGTATTAIRAGAHQSSRLIRC